MNVLEKIDLHLPALWDMDLMRRELDYDPRLIHEPMWETMTFMEQFKNYYQWCRDNPIISKFQLYITNQILDHVNGIRVLILKNEIEERYELNGKNTKLLLDHLLFDNKFCEVEKCDKKRERWLVFRSPRRKRDPQFPPKIEDRVLKIS